jgi:hypothetical protein
MGIQRSTLPLFLSAIALILMVSIANAQTSSNQSAQEEVATAASSSPTKAAASNVPAFKDYRVAP